MRCPACQTENPTTQKFCGECGAKLEKICPSCGAKNPAPYKFCGECGHNLTASSEPSLRELSFEEKLDKIQRYLPEGLTQKILSQPFELARDYLICGEIFKRKRDRRRTSENLQKAEEIFKKCGADGWVKKCEEELAAFS